ncbi:MAG: hypothetical protein KA603_02290 [Azonexus sp.]|nr:hypothetical protein [Betaproteobacteria bacterium]MBK7899761.1 hypothetical protein [Betaproteobacteria bacterium]MBK8919705.1 hypothetical protein [Betaproteobacteria bacterium]MBP6034951.1 hypothetical protein [Azonexus sp.]MBP6905657.1 hypothetical protein [Azonexus sp.]
MYLQPAIIGDSICRTIVSIILRGEAFIAGIVSWPYKMVVLGLAVLSLTTVQANTETAPHEKMFCQDVSDELGSTQGFIAPAFFSMLLLFGTAYSMALGAGTSADFAALLQVFQITTFLAIICVIWLACEISCRANENIRLPRQPHRKRDCVVKSYLNDRDLIVQVPPPKPVLLA